MFLLVLPSLAGFLLVSPPFLVFTFLLLSSPFFSLSGETFLGDTLGDFSKELVTSDVSLFETFFDGAFFSLGFEERAEDGLLSTLGLEDVLLPGLVFVFLSSF